MGCNKGKQTLADFVYCFISCVNWKGILENGQTLPEQLACEHAKDITFRLCERWGDCMN